MRWFAFFFVVLQVHSVPTPQRKPKIFMTNIDLDSHKKNRDPEVILDIGSQLPPVKRNTTVAPDYGDYEDYELTAITSTTPATTTTTEVKKIEEPIVLDSQFQQHSKLSLKPKKSSEETQDDVSRLMGDLHREELTVRTTISKENMTATTMDPMEVNMTMFFQDEEGSGDFDDDAALSNDTVPSTTRKPQLYTTLVQEVESVPMTARPDPFEHLDYDLTNHSNNIKPKKYKPDRLKKYKTLSLHGGAVDKLDTTKNSTIASVIVKPKRRKLLKKLRKIDKLKKVKNLNHRPRAHNRMRLRKVLSKMLFRSRDRVSSSHKSTKVKFVGSDGVVTPAPFNSENSTNIPNTPNTLKLNQIDSKTRRTRRDKRDIDAADLEPQQWEYNLEENNIVDTINDQPHPSFHLVERTQVEPSPMVNEVQMEEGEDDELYSEEPEQEKERDSLPVRNGLAQVSLDRDDLLRGEYGPRRLKMVPLSSMKKVVRKDSWNRDGSALVVPTAKKPTMLELLIGDFLERLPPTAHSPTLSEEQWS
uniref:Uncharacterized protein n=1 Tax=Caenorhabditis japonica TaxID=281687 RepID=A0A8R1DT69_CAEJA